MLGCSAILAAVAFLIGLLAALFSSEMGLRERFGFAGLFAAMTFIASAALIARDRSRHRARLAEVHIRMSARADLDNGRFVASVEPGDLRLALVLRDGLAQSIGISPSKIAMDDPLSEYAVEPFMPSIYLAVVGRALQSQEITTLGPFPRLRLETVRSLLEETKLQARGDEA